METEKRKYQIQLKTGDFIPCPQGRRVEIAGYEDEEFFIYRPYVNVDGSPFFDTVGWTICEVETGLSIFTDLADVSQEFCLDMATSLLANMGRKKFASTKKRRLKEIEMLRQEKEGGE